MRGGVALRDQGPGLTAGTSPVPCHPAQAAQSAHGRTWTSAAGHFPDTMARTRPGPQDLLLSKTLQLLPDISILDL